MPNVLPRLGPDSPLLTPSGRRRRFDTPEVVEQKAFMTLCVGRARKGEPRRMGDGMTNRHPELFLLYAINPNKGGQHSVAARGQAKGMGQLASVPDVHLPVARGPFIGLYLEFKQQGKYGSPEQRAIAERLRAEGHCVIEVQSCQEALDVTLGYLAIEQYVSWLARHAGETIESLRDHFYQLLRPKRGRAHSTGLTP